MVLPPARHLGTLPVRCAWRSSAGVWHGAAFEGLAAIGARFQPRRVELCPHPSDVSMTQIELPPLPARRQRIAVLGAVELLALTPPNNLAVGFGPRSDKGTVPVAWMSAGVLLSCVKTLREHGLPAHAVFPLPAFLPSPDDASWPRGEAAAVRFDDWLVLRTGAQEGAMHPVPAGCTDQPTQAEGGQAPVPWTGTGWNWTLPMNKAMEGAADRRWLGPAIGWAAAAAAVWLLGLNLHASQVAGQGQALARQMRAQVKAAYPEVSVVLNPLQQARQLRDARRAGVGSVASADFAVLVRASAALLPQAEGQVQALDFDDGQLQIRWREGATPGPQELKSLQVQAQEHGLAVQLEGGVLHVRVAVAKKGDDVAPTPAVASAPAASKAAP
ncbi:MULTISPECIES: type II secretion system protein GspL [unclassified Variovorax]|uniref:type II secretion system protein GspL n=1 Tax=unclassified Variovorax TaxID=663243 RepID=UPI003F4683F7